LHPDSQTYVTGDLIEAGTLAIGDGYRAKNVELSGAGIPFARAGNIDNGFLFDGADKFPEEDLGKVGEKISRPGDVVFTSKGTVGRFAFVREETPRFVFSPQLCYWRSLDTDFIDPHFLYYWMNGREFWKQASAVKGETDMADYVSLTDQRRMKLTLPPIEVQREIKKVLSALDDKIELNHQMNHTLEAMAQAIFKSWFVDFEPVTARAEGRRPYGMNAETAALFASHFVESELGPIPEGWSVVPVGDVMQILDSKRIPLSGSERDKRPGSYPYYGAADVMDYIDDYIFDGIYLLVGEDGSVVNDGGFPVTQYAWGRIWVNNHAHVLLGRNAVTTEMLLIFFRNTLIEPYVTGAVQPKLNQRNLKSIPFVLAKDEICVAFDHSVSALFEKIRTNTEESRMLSEIRDALLPKLLSGEIRVDQAEHKVVETA